MYIIIQFFDIIKTLLTQIQAKYPANPVGSQEAKILSHPGHTAV